MSNKKTHNRNNSKPSTLYSLIVNEELNSPNRNQKIQISKKDINFKKGLKNLKIGKRKNSVLSKENKNLIYSPTNSSSNAIKQNHLVIENKKLTRPRSNIKLSSKYIPDFKKL